MASLNRVLLIGNLTRDPEVRYIPSGTAVAELGLAVNESFRNKVEMAIVFLSDPAVRSQLDGTLHSRLRPSDYHLAR